MDKIVVNKKYINSLKIYSINKNSNIFINGDDLIKMPIIMDEIRHSNIERIILSNLERNIENIALIEGKDYVLPKYSLYTSKVETLNYKGYGMDFLKDYNTLSSVIENNEYTFKYRMYLCKLLCDAIVKLERYKLAYWDLHSKNVLVNGNNIKICDMDSIVSSKVSGEIKYKRTLMWSYKHLTLLVLSILYGIDDKELESMIKSNKKVKFVKDSKIFKRVIDQNYYMFYPGKYLDLFTEEYIEDTKLILKR